MIRTALFVCVLALVTLLSVTPSHASVIVSKNEQLSGSDVVAPTVVFSNGAILLDINGPSGELFKAVPITFTPTATGYTYASSVFQVPANTQSESYAGLRQTLDRMGRSALHSSPPMLS